MSGHGIPRVSGPTPNTDQARRKEKRKIDEYKTLVHQVNENIRNRQLTLDVLGQTSNLLQTNPEYYTIWNHRRLIMRHLFSGPEDRNSPAIDNGPEMASNQVLISDDLEFLLPLLRKFPKCYWIWKYRTWLLEEATRILPVADAKKLWQRDLGLVSKMLNLDNRNFHGWGYRRKVIAALESSRLSPNGEVTSMTEEEFKYTTKMIESNLSNFSAWHNRSKLIPRLLNERKADINERTKILGSGRFASSDPALFQPFIDDLPELELIKRALYTDPSDQSLWFYHQNLICTFDPAYADQTMAPDLSNEQRLAYVNHELESLLEMLDGAEDCKWIYQSLIELSLLYKRLSQTWPSQQDQMQNWVSQLEQLDPLRKRRWLDLKQSLDL